MRINVPLYVHVHIVHGLPFCFELVESLRLKFTIEAFVFEYWDLAELVKRCDSDWLGDSVPNGSSMNFSRNLSCHIFQAFVKKASLVVIAQCGDDD